MRSSRIWYGVRLAWLGVVLLLIGVPVILTVLSSFAATWQQWPWQSPSLRWHHYVLSNYGDALKVSLLVASGTMGITALIGVPAAYALVRYQFPGRRLLEDVLLLPLTLPGLALGLAIVQTYTLLRGQLLLLLLGHVLCTVPYVVQLVAASLRTSGILTLEAAAASLGARWWQRFWMIILPSAQRSIVAALLAVFSISLGEFNLSYFLYSPRAMPISVGMYEAYASLRIEIGSAFTTLFLAIIIPALIMGQRLQRRQYGPPGDRS